MDASANAGRKPDGRDGTFGRQRLDAWPPTWRGMNQVAANNSAMRVNRTQKLRWIGHGAYCVSAPPRSRAPAKPKAWAAVVIDAARFTRPSALNSTIAAVEDPAVKPTPTPMKARPANNHDTSGAIANRNAPTSE